LSATRSPERPLPTSAFDYDLPPERIAQHPARRRDESRLLVLRRDDGSIRHGIFRDIAELIQPGDALVLNETRVFPARLVGRRTSGAPAEVLLLHPLAERPGAEPPPAGAPDATVWEALVRPGSKLRPGRWLEVSDELRVEVVDVLPDGNRIVRLHAGIPIRDALERWGRIPLPPYVRREPEAADAERYQTVYARQEGSVAAPTAGLHFTPALLDALQDRGVHVVRLVLHVGVGTFRPVEVDDPARHVMHAEQYAVSEAAAAVLNRVRQRGGARWAVGTTVARTLETVAEPDGRVHAAAGWTDLFIRPPYRFRAVDRLITNFHLPRSTLLMLVAAFGGYEPVMHAYREAVAREYRFYSYGDAMAVI